LAKLERGSYDRGNQYEAIGHAVEQPSEYKSVLDDLDIGYKADILLDAEVRLGDLLKNRPPKKGKTKEYGSSGGTIPSLPTAII